MICTFLGHHDAPSSIKEPLKKVIIELIQNGVDEFVVGNNGNFDFYVQDIITELQNRGEKINFAIALSRIDEKSITSNQRSTVFPDVLEKCLPRFAISKRNEWMIKKSQIAVVYLTHNFSNTSKWVEKAKKQKLRIINIKDYIN